MTGDALQLVSPLTDSWPAGLGWCSCLFCYCIVIKIFILKGSKKYLCNRTAYAKEKEKFIIY